MLGSGESGAIKLGAWSLLEPRWVSAEPSVGFAICGASDPGPLGSGVGVAGACADAINGPGAATGEACAEEARDTKADAEPSVLGGSRAPNQYGRQPFYAGSTRDKSAGSDKIIGGALVLVFVK